MKKVLLDENLPRPLAGLISDDALEVISVHDMGWAEMKNGELLRAMVSEDFEYLLTADRNLQYQQNLASFPIKLAVLLIVDNRLKSLTAHVAVIRQRMLEFEAPTRVLEIDLRDLMKRHNV